MAAARANDLIQQPAAAVEAVEEPHAARDFWGDDDPNVWRGLKVDADGNAERHKDGKVIPNDPRQHGMSTNPSLAEAAGDRQP